MVIKTIGAAQKSIRVAAYTFTSLAIAQALIEAHKRGVDVKVVLDESNQEQRFSSIGYFKSEQVPTRINGHYAIMHNKFMIVDDSTLELGSFNYTKAGEDKNAENVLVIREAPSLAKDYIRQWERLWQEARIN